MSLEFALKQRPINQTIDYLFESMIGLNFKTKTNLFINSFNRNSSKKTNESIVLFSSKELIKV